MFDTECEFYVHLEKILNPTFELHKKTFCNFQTNTERMNFFINNLPVKELSCPFVRKEKNDERALEFRLKGNTEFKSENYMEALKCYTLSVSWAKSKSFIALAYANRSAVLSKLGLHKECVSDIDKAVECVPPAEVLAKIFERRIHSSQQLLGTTEKSGDSNKVTVTDKNNLIQSANNCVNIYHDNQYGRHLRATRDIQIGELIAVEEPFTCMLIEESLIRCRECLSTCYNLIPCEQCTEALYCSENCKVKAFDNYHKYECPILFSLISFLGPLKEILIFCTKMTILAKNAPNDTRQKKVYYSNRYNEISNLLTHSDKESSEKLFVVSCISALIFNLVKEKTTLFQDVPPFEAIFKEQFIKNLNIIEINFVEISQVKADVSNRFQHVGYALGIYSLFSLLNHSCYPNTFFYNQGSAMVVRANATIKKGEQCFISYGYHYTVHTKIDRQQALLRKYYFKCTCKACVEDWVHKGEPNKSKRLYTYIYQNLIKGNKDFARIILPMLTNDLKLKAHNVPRDSAVIQIQELITLCFYVSECI